jgi:hypothetical protein
MFEFGAMVRRGIASPACKHAVAAAALAAVSVFVSVNQVLVRLWTRGHVSGQVSVISVQGVFSDRWRLTPDL